MLRWLARVFASAVIRRLAFLVVGLLLAALGIGSARAASVSAGEAYALCMESASVHQPKDTNLVTKAGYCVAKEQPNGGKYYQCQYERAAWYNGPVGIETCGDFAYDEELNTCPYKPNQTGWMVEPLGTRCFEGCSYAYSPSDRAFSPTGSMCTPGPEDPEPVLDSDADGVPDDQDAFPNDPNESQDTDGDGIGDNADTAPDDPTNGDDKQDGDEKDNKASGGGECGSPPSCSGDAIACNTNWQVWKLRCTSAAVTGSPENCGTAYSCTGDAAQCTQIALLRKTACSNALQGNLDSDGDGFGVGDSANLKGIKDAITGAGKDLEGVDVPWMDGFLDQKEWSSGLGTGTCPAPIARTVTIAGYAGNVEFSFQPLCDFASLLYAVVVTLSAVSSAFIIAGVRK
ncbi:virulence factor TspB C-terminal domain-related protein [Xanthomonas campestris pv. raphani]|uniref:virulence factor TspB C-terminal domain-related protein n=1 Tax=Xanthomonas campestris TaxID=339 RepID=UPI002B238B8D|nr:virulence factor TspB C-terminal domain-related protein [Xanthomonas campestris]MEA9787072.1 virulence factor TspB C-terminal domain-related protein [Xanthomonas campestris pv. raphani]